MSAGETVEHEAGRVLRAAGTLVTMVVIRRISRDKLQDVADVLESSARGLRAITEGRRDAQR